MGVGSSAGSSVAVGSSAASSANSPAELARSIPTWPCRSTSSIARRSRARRVVVLFQPDLRRGCRAKAGQPAAGEIALCLRRVDRRQALRPQSRDRFPAVVTAGPGSGRGTADEPAVCAHQGEQRRGEVVRTVGRCSGQDARPQRGLVIGQLRTGGRAAPRERSLDAILEADQPMTDIPVDDRLAAVAHARVQPRPRRRRDHPRAARRLLI